MYTKDFATGISQKKANFNSPSTHLETPSGTDTAREGILNPICTSDAKAVTVAGSSTEMAAGDFRRHAAMDSHAWGKGGGMRGNYFIFAYFIDFGLSSLGLMCCKMSKNSCIPSLRHLAVYGSWPYN